MRRLGVPLVVVMLVLAGRAPAQDLPGTPSGEGSTALNTPYGQELPAPGAPTTRARRGRPRPWLTIVPDLRMTVGYSDNIFITPDVIGFRPIADGAIAVAPRLRWLTPVGARLGLVGDYGLQALHFFDNGESYLHSGRLFLGYRPVAERHAEIGWRGGLGRVTDFERGDFDEGHLFVDGTWGFDRRSSIGASVSAGVRNFPNRVQAESSELLGGLLPPLPPPLPPITTTTSRTGQRDVLLGVVGRFFHAYSATGHLRLGYDYSRSDSDFSPLDHQSHRVSIGSINLWTPRISSEIVYAARFRGFSNPLPTDPAVRRRDTIHALSLGMSFAPATLQGIPGTRATTLRLAYDLLIDRSNVSSAEFDRSYLALTLDVGLQPLTSEELWKAIFPGFASPPPSRSYSSAPPSS